MVQLFLPNALLLLLATLLVGGIVTDIRARIIPNGLNAAIALLAPLYWWSLGLSVWPDMAIQIGLAAGIFAIFAILFAIGMMGGGDVKMLAALALWLPMGGLANLIVLMALLGGVVTIVAVVHHRSTRRIGRVEVPYGVAIGLAALWVIGEPYFNLNA